MTRFWRNGLLVAAVPLIGTIAAGACTTFGSDAEADAGPLVDAATAETARLEPDARSEAPDLGDSGVPSVDSAPPEGCPNHDAGYGVPNCSDASVHEVACPNKETCRNSTPVCCDTGRVVPPFFDCRAECAPGEDEVRCDGPDDCALGEVCCGEASPARARCSRTCAPPRETFCTEGRHCRNGNCNKALRQSEFYRVCEP